MNEIEHEKFIRENPFQLTLEEIKIIKEQMEKSVCIITSKDKNRIGIGTGFFCKFKNNNIKTLVTCKHVISEIQLNEKIIISLNERKENKEIKLDQSRIINPNPNLDITIIVLKDNEFKICHFLELDDNIDEKDNINIKYLYEKEPIYIIHYPEGKKLTISFGKLYELNEENEIYHKCCTNGGSSGSPILSLDKKK